MPDARVPSVMNDEFPGNLLHQPGDSVNAGFGPDGLSAPAGLSSQKSLSPAAEDATSMTHQMVRDAEDSASRHFPAFFPDNVRWPAPADLVTHVTSSVASTPSQPEGHLLDPSLVCSSAASRNLHEAPFASKSSTNDSLTSHASVSAKSVPDNRCHQVTAFAHGFPPHFWAAAPKMPHPSVESATDATANSESESHLREFASPAFADFNSTSLAPDSHRTASDPADAPAMTE